jgi:hypothetical protein
MWKILFSFAATAIAVDLPAVSSKDAATSWVLVASSSSTADAGKGAKKKMLREIAKLGGGKASGGRGGRGGKGRGRAVKPREVKMVLDLLGLTVKRDDFKKYWRKIGKKGRGVTMRELLKWVSANLEFLDRELFKPHGDGSMSA